VGTGAANPIEPGSPITVDEWARLPEDAVGEAVDGMLVEDEVTDFVHEVVVAFFVELFRGWARVHGGLVAGSEPRFAVSSSRGRKADVCVYLPGDPRPPARGIVDVPPSVLIEVVSPRPRDARRDRVEKLQDYAQFGVRYYWIVDPQLRTVEIYERAPDGRYIRAMSAVSGLLDHVPGFPGIEVDLDGLWSELDELETAAT
jgi:Uma2 family endonuclease